MPSNSSLYSRLLSLETKLTNMSPTVINDAYLSQVPVASTFYTVLDLTDGKGILSSINIEFSGQVAKAHYIKITTDDNTAVTFLQNGNAAFAVAYNGNANALTYRYNFNLYFSKSLKIEVSNETDTTQMFITALYSTLS